MVAVKKLAALLIGVVPSTNGLSFDVASATGRPVSKVVDLLKGMQEQVEKEGEEDQKTYDTYKCWCKTNGEDKQKAIAEQQGALPGLQARVEYLKSKADKLKAEVEKIENEVAANKASLSTATALRDQEKKEFDKDAEKLNKNINAVGDAKDTIAGKAAFLQNPRQATNAKLQSLLSFSGSRLSSADRLTLQSFIQQGADGPSMGSITGVLNGMADDFASDLTQLTEQEQEAIRVYTELKKAKEAEIDAGIKLIEKKKEEKAAANEERAIKKQDIKDMGGSLADDVAFAKEVMAKCEVMDKEFDERSQTRNEEIEAISKAIEVLDADEAHDNFAKTLAFLQESSRSSSRERASEALRKAGFATLAMRAKLDSFTKVKAAIDEMVSALKSEQAAEVEKRDFCVAEFRKNEMATQEKTADRTEVAAKIATLKINVEKTAETIKTLEAEVADLKTQMQLASQNREAENSEFQKVVAEQRETQELLGKALTVLQGFYNKESLVQIRAHGEPPAPEPATFKDYKKNSQSFGVMGMMQQIMTDTKAMEAEATRAEATAQENYEAFAKETTASVATKTKLIADKTSEKATFEKNLVESKSALEGHDADLAALATTKAELEDDCNFLLKNFDMRQNAFTEEMDSLKQAKSILSGAKY